MAKYTDSACRVCRREGTKLFLKGDRCFSGKCALTKRPVAPGQHGTGRKKVSEYGLQLREKQKTRKAYGLLEKQFRLNFDKAEKMKGATGVNMLILLERRLDNVAYRMGLATSRAQARQLVTHAHLTVNGHTVNIPSYIVKVGDVVAVKETRKNREYFKKLAETKKLNLPKWLDFNMDNLEGKVLALPEREDIDLSIAENMIVEYYSR